MKLHLPKLLLTAVLAVVGITSNVWADTPVYSGTVYTFVGNTSGTELAFSILQYDNNGESTTIQGVSNNWGDISSAIASTATDTDRNTLKLGDGYAKGLTYTFNPIAVAGFIVEASGYSITTGSTGGSRNIEIGNATATKAYTTINYDFSITNNARSDAYIKLLGTQEWNIADNATLTLNAGSSSSVILADGSAITQNGGTVNLFGDSVTGTGSYIVSSGTLSNAVFKSGATLGLGSSAVLSAVTMESGSVLDLTAKTLSSDSAAVSTTGITLNSGLIVSLSNVTEGETVKLFDSSVSGVSFIIDGKNVVEARSEIAENSGSYTFTTLVGNLHDMVWAGGDGTWNKTNTNWNSASSGTGMAFVDGDTVSFSSSAAVDVDGGVSVGGMTVSGSTTVLSLTRSNSGYIAGDVTVEGGAKLVIGSETGRTGFVRGDIEVANGTLQFDAKDATGYDGGVNSTQNIKITANSQLLLNHNSNETFAGDIVLNGTMKGVSASGSARWDLYGGSASLSVETGNTATLENVVLQLRQNDSEITVANDATLTLEKGMSKGAEGNGKFKKLGNGALSIEGTIDVSGISVNGGSVAFSAGGSTGDISMNANDTTLLFNAADNATADAPTTYTVGNISTTTGNWFNRNITIADNVRVNASGLTNSWGMGTLLVDGELVFSGDLNLSTGGNTMGEKNIISGAGSVTTATLTTGNVGKYTLNVKSLTATSSTIGQHTQVIGGEANLGALTLSGKLEANGGKVVISSTSGNGTITGTAGSIELNAGDHTVGTLDLSNSDTAQGIATVKTGAVLGVGTLWGCSTSYLALEEGATLTVDNVAIVGNNSKNVAKVTSSSNDYYQSNKDGFSIANATITISNTTDEKTIGNNLVGTSKLVKEGEGTLKLTNTANTHTGGTDVKAGKLVATTGAALGKTGTTTISGGSLEIDDAKATITKSNADTNATITYIPDAEGNTGEAYGIGNSGYQVENAKVELAANSGTTISNRLVGVELVNNGTGTITAGNGFNDFTSINAASGDITLRGLAAEADTGNVDTVTNLSIGENRTLSVYAKWSTDMTEATVKVTGSANFASGAKMNGNLVLANGATVTMAEALTMGSTVTLGTGMTLAGDLVSTIKSMSEDGTVDLFKGVDALYLGDSTLASGTLDATSGVNLDTYFNFEGAGDYYLGYDGQTVYAGVMQAPVTPAVPEPTTATLSLLALAYLAARRRRR